MRVTMRPVSLARVLSTLWAFDEGGVRTAEQFARATGSNERRAMEILSEAQAGTFLTKKRRGWQVSQDGRRLLRVSYELDYEGIHRELLRHPHYEHFHKILADTGETAPRHAFISSARADGSPNALNATSAHVLGEWSERCGSAQRTLEDERWYRTRMTPLPSSREMAGAILRSYRSLDRPSGQFFRKRFVEIPLLRERLCMLLHLHRIQVDELLLRFYREHLGECELAGAPMLTHAKASRFKIRRLITREDFMTFIPSGEAFMELPALLWKGKRYYFFAFHGG